MTPWHRFLRPAIILPLLLLVPALGEAQTLTPYSVSLRPQAFQPLPINHPDAQPVQDLTAAAGLSSRVEIQFPVRFFDVDQPKVYVVPQGFIEFTDSSTWFYSNVALPNGNSPNGIIAPWWDDLDVRGTGGHVKSQIIGTAPNRILVVEWRAGMWSMGTAFANFQVWLYEGSSTIEFHYGSIASGASFHASMGIEDYSGNTGYSVPANPSGAVCNPSCGTANWLTDTVVTFSQGPELRTGDVTGLDEAFAGLPMPVSARVTNVGGKPAESFTMRFYVSPTPAVTSQSIELVTLDGDVRSLQPQESTVFEASPRLPITLDEGQYYIVAQADPHEVVPETNRGDNFSAFGPFTIGLRAANLVVDWVDAPDLVKPGETFTVRWRASNTGNLEAVGIPYSLNLSPTGSISPAWPNVGSGVIDGLAMGQSDVVTTQVTVPSDADVGIHYLTVEINANRMVFEHERGDNFGISNPIVIAQEDLVVQTETLPAAQIQGHYNMRLRAVGGDGSHLWRVAPGSVLPPGLFLAEEIGQNGEMATFLRGVPSRAGTSAFVLEVSSTGLVVAREYELEVLPTNYDLQVVTEHLADGAFGFPYEDELMAIGGLPPYTWELVKGDLPLGLFLRPDGVLSGRPEKDGTFHVTVRVRDSAGRQGIKDLELFIASPSSLTCVTRRLEPLAFGEHVQVAVHAAGGERGPNGYLWSSKGTTWLATEIGEKTEFRQGPPPGLNLDGDGVITGAPQAFGSFVWTLHVKDQSGGEGVDCPIRLDVPRDRGLTVVTQRLPTAVAGRSYRTQLEAAGGDGELTWAEYGGGRILDDLELYFDATGALVGTPPLSLLQGESEREFTITVRVTDQANRIGVGVVTLTLKAPGKKEVATQEEEGGCQTGSGEATLWALAILALALLRRRR